MFNHRKFYNSPSPWLFTLAVLLITPFHLIAQSKINLSDLPLSGVQQEILLPVANKSMTGAPIKVNGKIFQSGISVHAPFTGRIFTAKKATRLTGFIGVDDAGNRKFTKGQLDSFARTDGLKTFFYPTKKGRTLLGVGYKSGDIAAGSVQLYIYGDGRKLWSSGVMRQGNAAKKIDIPLNGVDVLEMVVSDGGDGISGDVADLAMLQIQTSDAGSVRFVPETFRSETEKRNNKPAAQLAAQIRALPDHRQPKQNGGDWLVTQQGFPATVSKNGNGEVVMDNGLVRRTLYFTSNVATISLRNGTTGEEYMRSVQPEAIVKIDQENFNIGGLSGQVDRGYLLKSWLPDMYGTPGSFVPSALEVRDLKQPISWKAKRWIPETQWAYKGKELLLTFIHPDKPGIRVLVSYKIFDHMPLMAKSISVINNSKKNITVNHFSGEIIAYPEPFSAVSDPAVWRRPNFHLENDYAFGGMNYEESKQSISWETDPEYTSQVNYNLKTICKVRSTPEAGPAQQIAPGKSWSAFNTYFLALDGTEIERNTLSQRKMYRMLAPWATENPIFMHLTSTDPKVVHEAVSQCKATGYEMIILSFGSGLNMEDTSRVNLDKFKDLAEYAHKNGIEIGGYSLFSSRSIDPQNDVINIKTGKPGGTTFGNAPCLGSDWGIAYLKKLENFFSYTGFDLLEHDGPYPGDFCASTSHPGHHNYFDSQWAQWKQSIGLYQQLRARDVYMNLPDFYILSGSNKSGIGYREVNWSLPRAQQIVLGRQNIYDGTWTRTPSMGWTFVPLVEYHGGGAAATLEPLSEHLDAYNAHMLQNYGSGVQACYRGNRLYDTPETEKLVRSNIDHYKKYRNILNADIIHLRRPTGRDWDGLMHVDPRLDEKAYVLLFNPLSETITREIDLPLYYTGLENQATLFIDGEDQKRVKLDANANTKVKVTIPANGSLWILVKK